jgi:hypothetical protein
VRMSGVGWGSPHPVRARWPGDGDEERARGKGDHGEARSVHAMTIPQASFETSISRGCAN